MPVWTEILQASLWHALYWLPLLNLIFQILALGIVSRPMSSGIVQFFAIRCQSSFMHDRFAFYKDRTVQHAGSSSFNAFQLSDFLERCLRPLIEATFLSLAKGPQGCRFGQHFCRRLFGMLDIGCRFSISFFKFWHWALCHVP